MDVKFCKADKIIMWYCPMERFVIFPDKIKISHSMRNLINKNLLYCTINKDFSGVIDGCSKVNNRNLMDGAWLGPDIIEAYTNLHKMGYATSVEVWHGDKLVGGLYGVTIGLAFFGESMFSIEPNASKMALVFLAQRMTKFGELLIDCQFETGHLKSMGGERISYERYIKIIGDGKMY